MILVTNDDGIHSEGLWSIAQALRDEGDVTVVAPDRDLSGVGAAITLLSVVRAQEVASPMEGTKTYSVEGTPGDCVILGAQTLCEEPIDLVVSGINHGWNMGLDVMTSGTVGAAYQGYCRGIPSIALSVASFTDVGFETASRAAKALARAISQNSVPGPLFLNVNLPDVAPDRIERVEITRLAPTSTLWGVEQSKDGRRTHYWIKQNRPTSPQAAEGSDIWAVRNNRISITPLDLAFNYGRSPRDLDALADEVATSLGLRM